MANRYGIDMGNIMKTTSALKTAKLRRDKAQKDMDRENLEDEAYGDDIAKNNPSNMIAATDDNQDGVIDDNEKLSAKRKTGMKYNALAKIEDRKEKKKDREQIRKNRMSAEGRAAGRYKMAQEKHNEQKQKNEMFSKSLEKIALANGATPDEAKLIGEGGIKQVGKTVDFVSNANDKQVEGLITMNAGLIKGLTEIGEVGAENPQQAEQQYQTALKAMDDSILEAAKSGNKKQLEQLENMRSTLPQTLISEKGFNFNNLQLTMAKAQNNIDNIQDIRRLNSSTKTKDDTPSYSQVKTHLREVRKVAKDSLEFDATIDENQKEAIISNAVKIAQNNPNITAEEALARAKGKKPTNNIPKKKGKEKNNKFREGGIYIQNGVKYKYTGGKFIPQK